MTSQRWVCRWAVFVLCCLNISSVTALTASLCSNMNTAGGNGNYSIYQSNGLCYDFCPSSAFAILQGANCWCSNVAPGDTTSVSDCNTPCVGYPDDLCGNTASGLWGYFKIPGNNPTSTAGGGSNQQTTPTQAVAEASDPNTVFVTVFPTASSESSSKTTNPPTTTPADSSGDSSSEMTWTPTPVTSLETVTGQVRTVTVTPTVPPDSQNTGQVSSKGKSAGGLGTGGAVGLTIGLVALVAIISAIIYFCWRRRQKEKEKEKEVLAYNDASRGGSSAGFGGPIPSRTMSENSRYVLNTDGRQVIESYEGDLPGSRRSRLMPVDPRLNPHAPLYQRGENKSRESINTIRDDHDYSRPVHQQGPILRATNPDQ